MPAGLYKGYSSYEFQRAKTFRLTDVELVKMDLLNHIFTRRGDRLHMPTFGTNIPDLAFEPMDEITVDIIRDDILHVVNFDPRVKLLDLNIQPDYDNSTIIAEVKLEYLELRVQDTMYINLTFEQE